MEQLFPSHFPLLLASKCKAFAVLLQDFATVALSLIRVTNTNLKENVH